MAYRRRTSTLDDLLKVAMKMPLWANLLIACGSFVTLRYYGGSELPTMGVVQTGHLAESIGFYILRLAAFIGQFVIPPIFLLGGILGWIQRTIRARKFRSISRSSQPGVLIRNLTWDQFERMVGEALRRQGYAVNETAKGPDGGIDLELRRGGELFLVQCKQWRAEKVSVQVVRELYGVMSARGAAGGYVVTSGVFTKDAWKFAKGTSVRLIDGNRLVEWFGTVSTGEQNPPSMNGTSAAVTAGVTAAPGANQELDGDQCMQMEKAKQLCPRCGGGMTPRFSQSNSQGISNNVFLGCLNFPSCRGTGAQQHSLTHEHQ
ncbi:restriction endonuclease [Pseudomonas mohnii]